MAINFQNMPISVYKAICHSYFSFLCDSGISFYSPFPSRQKMDEDEIIYKLQRSFKVSSRVHDDTVLVSSFVDSIRCVCSESDNVFHQFEKFERSVLKWESSTSKHKSLENCFDDAKEYVAAVDSNIHLLDDQVLLSNEEYSDRVYTLKRTVMMSLRDVFHHVLVMDSVPLDADLLGNCEWLCRLLPRVSLSSASNADEDVEYESSLEEEDEENYREDGSEEALYLNLVNSDSICVLNLIAGRMIRAGYEVECRAVYVSARCDALREYLSILGVEIIDIGEVQTLDLSSLDEMMQDWIQAINVVSKFLLCAEKQLCDQVFGCSEQFKEVCFSAIGTDCVMRLLNFGENLIKVQQSPENLFRIIEMYDALANARLDLKSLVNHESSDIVCTEAERALAALGEAAKGAYIKFEMAVKSDSSREATHDAEVHPFLRAAIRYIILVVADLGATLNFLMENNADSSQGFNMQTLLGRRLLDLVSSLESNIQNKSKLYGDKAMRYVFLMNNIFHMVVEIKSSKLGGLLGDIWVRERHQQVRDYADCYLRAAWGKALSCVKEEGLVSRGIPTVVRKDVLKTRFKKFNAVFEAIYKSQTGWKVQNLQLRDELRVKILEGVIRAYRYFHGRYKGHLESGKHSEKYLKYTAEDLEDYLFDLFEGTPKRLHDSP